MGVHPRLCVNSICSLRQSLDDDISLWAEIGVHHAGLIAPKLEQSGWAAGRRAVTDAGLRVSSMSAYLHEMEDSIPFTAEVGCGVLYTVAGAGQGRAWDDAARHFCDVIGPFRSRAAGLGVRLALEATNPLRSDVSFVHTVRDAVDLARLAGMDVVVDLYSAWYERDLARVVADNVDLVALVQIGDYRLGTLDMPNRCAVGDGDIPVERVMGEILAAGYSGPFELEILGPAVEAEGYRAPIVRSLERTTSILDRLGA